MVFFEAPVAHMASPHGNPYTHSEFENEWELHPGSHFTHSEFEGEWEQMAGNPYTHSEFEGEWEQMAGNPYSQHELEIEGEWEQMAGNPYSQHELEDESEFLGNILRGIGGLFGGGGEEGEMEFEHGPDRFFFGKIKSLIGRIKNRVRGLARRALTIVPGVTRVISSIASESPHAPDRMLHSLAQEAEMEVARVENHFTDRFAQTGEAEHPALHAAVMSELMAANAANSQSEAEAEAMIAATIPLTIRLMRAQRTMLPVTPGLVQANVRLVRTLRRQGQDGRQLLRLLPTIHRNTVEILRILSNQQRLTTPLAVRALGVATRRVMSNPRRTQRALQRNIALQIRTSGTSRQRGSLPLRPVPRRQRVAI